MVRFHYCRSGEQNQDWYFVEMSGLDHIHVTEFEDVLLDLQTNNRALTNLYVEFPYDEELNDADKIIQILREIRHHNSLKYLCIDGHSSLSAYGYDFGQIHLAIAEAFKCNISVSKLAVDLF